MCGLQVYTVGPDYAHAEARKSPALDGKVERDSEGKEIRYPVMLSAMEKLVARKVCLAFKVTYCLPGIYISRIRLVQYRDQLGFGPIQRLYKMIKSVFAVFEI